MDDGFPYRVKFRDIRVKPPADDVSREKAAKTRVCEQKGCDLAGEHKAPKRNARGVHWFCQRHAAEYNRSFNFFDNMTEAEIKAFEEAARYGHKKTWKFGTGPAGGMRAAHLHDRRRWRGADLFEDGASAAAPERKAGRGRTRLQVRALNELDLEANATAQEIRERYSDYVRRFHPDSNKGDRSSEHKLARVLRAGKTLKAAGLMKR
ncbi:MAG: J domain-containing protein [Pseudomonadota bacterium]